MWCKSMRETSVIEILLTKPCYWSYQRTVSVNEGIVAVGGDAKTYHLSLLLNGRHLVACARLSTSQKSLVWKFTC